MLNLLMNPLFVRAARYAYDASGNRTDRAVGTSSYLSSVSNTSNRITSVQEFSTGPTGFKTNVYTYDAAGHLSSDGSNTYTTSDRGRMSSLSLCLYIWDVIKSNG